MTVPVHDQQQAEQLLAIDQVCMAPVENHNTCSAHVWQECSTVLTIGKSAGYFHGAHLIAEGVGVDLEPAVVRAAEQRRRLRRVRRVVRVHL